MPLSQTAAEDALGGVFVNSREPTTPSTPTAITAGVASGALVASNLNRKGLVVTNTSSNTVSLNLAGGTAVLNSGIVLYPGWIWEMDEFTYTTNAITVIASAASSNVAIQEFS